MAKVGIVLFAGVKKRSGGVIGGGVVGAEHYAVGIVGIALVTVYRVNYYRAGGIDKLSCGAVAVPPKEMG